MPQEAKNTAGMSNNSTVQTFVNNTSGKFISGRLVYASDVNQIINGFNNLNNHSHAGIADIRGKDTYGNIGRYGSVTYDGTNESTSGPIGMNGDVGVVSTGQTITSAKHNEMANALNSARSHYHTWDDATS